MQKLKDQVRSVADRAAEQQGADTRAAWDAIAAGYDEFVTPRDDWALPKEALRRAGLRAGMRFLDVACGSGALALPAARLGAHVMAVDQSSVMVELLRKRARAEGLAKVEARVMDGHALELDDDTFDIAGSQFGVMLFPDLPRGLRELVRVTRPGGRVLMVVYGTPQQVEFLTFFLAALHAVMPGFTGPSMDPPPLPFQVANPNVLRQRLSDAGLKDIRIGSAAERLAFANGKDMWNWVVNSNPIVVSLIEGLSQPQRGDVVDVLDGMLRERAGLGGAAVLTAPVNIGIGTR